MYRTIKPKNDKRKTSRILPTPILPMLLPPNKKVYFLSDFHLGAPNAKESLIREKKIVAFLDEIRTDAAVIFIVGDIFDFWYGVPEGSSQRVCRLLGKLAEITDAGIPVHFFVGNHDMWMTDYFQKELNIPVYFEPWNLSLMVNNFLLDMAMD
jgi:UDP-2,3-diacylglucosamine hydrolase